MRRTKTLTIPGTRTDELYKRDNGKSFVITEMPADEAERFGITAVMALLNNGAQIDDAALGAGMAGLALAGLDALNSLKAETLAPLLVDMFACIKYVPDIAGLDPQPIMAGEGSQIEEWSTRLKLRAVWFELHTGFSLPAFPLTSGLPRTKGGTQGG